jgi:hypothetical protein
MMKSLQLTLHAERKLLHLGTLQPRIDDVDPGRAGTGKNKAGKWIGDRRCEWRDTAGRLIHEQEIARPHLDWKRPAIPSSPLSSD